MDGNHPNITSLLHLSPEIRNQIYHELLPVGRYYGIGGGSANTVADLQALSKVNRHLRNEVLPIFYGNTEFLITIESNEDASKAITWLSRLEDWQASLILVLTIDVNYVASIHISVHPDEAFPRSGVTILSHRRTRDSWSAKSLRKPKHFLDKVTRILDGIKADSDTPRGDSGLRVHHIASILIAIFYDGALSARDELLLTQLEDKRRYCSPPKPEV